MVIRGRNSSSNTTNIINDHPGHPLIRVLGMVYGLTIHSRSLSAPISANLKVPALLGRGQLKPLRRMLRTSRNMASEWLVGECMSREVNAVVAMM